MSDLELSDLVANGTMSRDIARTLTATVRGGHSFVVFAVPRLAGKTTVVQAMLAQRKKGVPARTVTGEPAEQAELQRTKEGGYLVVPEIANSGVPGYLWGAPVRRIFKTLASGYALAVALHAPGVREAFEIVSHKNAVPDEAASRLRLAVYIRSMGDWRAPTARRVTEVHEVERVVAGEPQVRLLHRWDEASDRFVTVEEPRAIAADRAPWPVEYH